MCIIAVKPAGKEMPTPETIRRMWDNNPDGAGFMYAPKSGGVIIEKGFMKRKELEKRLTELDKTTNLKKIPVVMHFRITTHGGTCAANCHPFPITDNITALAKPRTKTDLGVAHNGIINSVTPRKGISDTMEYIASQLAPLKRGVPQFYRNKHLMQMIANATDSKLAFLTGDGGIYTVGTFTEDKKTGLLYSNYSYEYSLYRGAYGNCGCLADYGYDDKYNLLDDNSDAKLLMWVGDAWYKNAKGDLIETYDMLIDEKGNLYEYLYNEDAAVRASIATIYTENGTLPHFDEDHADLVSVIDIGDDDDDIPPANLL